MPRFAEVFKKVVQEGGDRGDFWTLCSCIVLNKIIGVDITRAGVRLSD